MCKDKTLKCRDCSKEFIFTFRDQTFYADKGYNDPVRCRDCRDFNKRNKIKKEEGSQVNKERSSNEYSSYADKGYNDPVRCRDCRDFNKRKEIYFQPKEKKDERNERTIETQGSGNKDEIVNFTFNPGYDSFILSQKIIKKIYGDKDLETIEKFLKEIAILILNYQKPLEIMIPELIKTNVTGKPKNFPLHKLGQILLENIELLRNYPDDKLGHMISGCRDLVKANLSGMNVKDLNFCDDKEDYLNEKDFYENSLKHAKKIMTRDGKKLSKFKQLKSAVSHSKDPYIVLNNVAFFYSKMELNRDKPSPIKDFLNEVIDMFQKYRFENIKKFIIATVLHMDAIEKGVKYEENSAITIEKIINDIGATSSNLNKLKKMRTLVERAENKYQIIRRLSTFAENFKKKEDKENKFITELIKLANSLDIKSFKKDLFKAILIKEGFIAEANLREEALAR